MTQDIEPMEDLQQYKNPRPFMTVKEVATYYQKTEKTIYRWLQLSQISAKFDGDIYKFYQEDLEYHDTLVSEKQTRGKRPKRKYTRKVKE